MIFAKTPILTIAIAVCITSAALAREIKLDGRTFVLPDGFSIERVAGPPLIDRPIEADFDEQGRLYVTDSSGTSDKPDVQLKTLPHRALRLQDTTGNGHFDKATVFAGHLMFPEGAMWDHGSLYVAAPPSIWRLIDSTGAGVADRREEFFAGKTLTGCANDLHGPYMGPDGWIYWCKGAFAEQTYQRPGHKPLVTRAAHIFRARRDGSHIEPVMTGGMDNPIEVAFTPGGERIFSTTFLQNPAGGHRDGLIHAVYGGIYGKVHDVTDDHPHTSPELMPVLSQLGPAPVCGLTRYESDVFGPEYRDNLFATCFNLHKVTRHVLSPDGATFKSADQDFLTCDSLDFHPTDVLEDADGSLLIIDTGGWYKLCCPTSQLGKPDLLGAIYRIRREGAKRIADPRGLKLVWDTMNPQSLEALLDDPRPAVRNRATSALADKGPAALPAIQAVIETNPAEIARLNGVWAATRIDAPEARRICRLGLSDADETVRQAAAHSASVWRDAQAIPALVELLAGKSMHNQRVAAEALGRIGDPAVIPAIFSALAKPTDQVLDHSLTYALIEIDQPGPTAKGLSSDNPRVRRSAMIALDQMENGKVEATVIAQSLTASDAPLRATAGWIAGRHAEWGAVLVDTFRKRLQGSVPGDAEIEALRSQLAHLAKSPAIADFLAGLLADDKTPQAWRRLALGAIGESGLNALPASLTDGLIHALSTRDPGFLAATVEAIGKLSLSKKEATGIPPALKDVANRGDIPASVRLTALAAIPGGAGHVSPELFAFLTARLAMTQPPTDRLAAAQVLGHCALTADQLLALADAMKGAGPMEIDRLLFAFNRSNDPAVGIRLLAALGQSKGVKGLRAEKLKAVIAHYDKNVQTQAEPLLASLSPDAAKQKARIDQLLATLPRGDVRRGQGVFNSAKVGCVACHAIGYVGGQVGPDLTSVGKIRSRPHADDSDSQIKRKRNPPRHGVDHARRPRPADHVAGIGRSSRVSHGEERVSSTDFIGAYSPIHL